MALFALIKKTSQLAGVKQQHTIVVNAMMLALLQIISYLIPIILIPYLFRTIGADKFGVIAFAQASLLYFMIITDYGFNTTAVKEISLYRSNSKKTARIFSSVMAAKIILTAGCLIIGTLLCLAFNRFRQEWLVYLFGAGMVIGNSLCPLWFFQGIEKMKYTAVINAAREIFTLAFILLFVKHADDYPMVVFISALAYLAAAAAGQWIIIKYFKINFIWPDKKSLRHEFIHGWEVFASSAAINAYTASRIFILGLFANNTLTGLYSIAERIANAVQTFPLNAFSQAIFPRLSKIFHTDRKKAWMIMRQVQEITTSISLVLIPFVIIFAPQLVKLVCGQNYPQTVVALRILLLSVIVVTANAFKVQFLLVCARTDIYLRIHIIMAVLGLPLILAATAALSYTGSALATIIMELMVFIFTDISLEKIRVKK